MSTVAQLEVESVAVEAGEHVVLPLSVRNSGEVVEDYRLEVLGVPARWTTVEPAQFTLYPGTSQLATLDVHPPRSPDVPAGQLQFGVHVIPSEHPDQAVVPEAVIELLPFLETTAELVPHASHGSRRGRHQLAVDNRGNVPVSALVTAVPGTDTVTVEVSAGSVTVQPGHAVFVDLDARPVGRIWRGLPRTHPFTVLVDPQDSTEVTLPATYVQDPLLPPWFFKALLALLALLLLLALAWFLLLKPTVQSAAKEAVAEPAKSAATDAAVAQQAANAAKQNEQSAAGAADQAKAAAAGTPAPAPAAASAPATVTAPFAGRLPLKTAPGSSGTVSFAVGTGQSLSLTDFVLENPQGDEGLLTITLTIANKDQVLLTQSLESFRTTDYHFVTPFVAPEGSKLVMKITCNKVGTPPSTAPPTTCSNAVTFGGPLTRPAG